jgi:hypothetical protein
MKSSLLLFVICSGCVQMGASSRGLMTVPLPVAEAEPQLIAQFDKRGFHLVERTPTGLTFKGIRTNATSVYERPLAGRVTQSETIGSIFYARLTPDADGSSLLLYGKPTVAGQPVCSAPDAEFGVACTPLERRGPTWAGESSITGREEDETIKGVSLELGATPTHPAAVATRANCHVEGTPAWAKASAFEKKKLLESCRF